MTSFEDILKQVAPFLGLALPPGKQVAGIDIGTPLSQALADGKIDGADIPLLVGIATQVVLHEMSKAHAAAPPPAPATVTSVPVSVPAPVAAPTRGFTGSGSSAKRPATSVNWGLMTVARLSDGYQYTPDEKAAGKFTGGEHVLFVDVNALAADGGGADFEPFASAAVVSVDGGPESRLSLLEDGTPVGKSDFVSLGQQPYLKNEGGRFRIHTAPTPQGTASRKLSLNVAVGTVLGTARILTFSWE